MKSMIYQIGHVILNSLDKELIVTDIYHQLIVTFGQSMDSKASWRGNIHHNLMVHQCFVWGMAGDMWREKLSMVCALQNGVFEKKRLEKLVEDNEAESRKLAELAEEDDDDEGRKIPKRIALPDQRI